MASRAANNAADAGTASQPWELRDQRFKASQAKATGHGGESNGRASGTASLPSLHHNTEADDSETEEHAASDKRRTVASAVDPTLERRGLAHEIKARMIEMFAQFQSVSQVGDAIKKEFGLALDRRTLEAFNPDSHRCRVGKRLKSLFNSQRDAYIKECAKVGVSHQAHRLRLIGQIVDKATTAKDFANALKGLELAGKEMNAYAQEVKHSGIVSHVHGTVEEARRELADRLKALAPVLVEPTVEPTVDSTATLVGPTDNGPSSLPTVRP